MVKQSTYGKFSKTDQCEESSTVKVGHCAAGSNTRNMVLSLITVCSYMVSISNVVLNLLLIIALQKRGKLKILSYWLITGLCISDSFVGIVGLLKESLLLKVKFGHSSSMEVAWLVIITLESFWVNFSSLFVLIIAIDRYIHMKHGLNYQTLMTKRRATWLVIFNVVFTSNMVVTVIILPKYQKELLLRNLLAYQIYRVILSLTYLSFILAIFVLYIKEYLSIKRVVASTVEPASHDTAETNFNNNCSTMAINLKLHRHGRRSPEQEFGKIVGLVIITLVLCMTPNLCISFYKSVAMLTTANYRPPHGLRIATRWTFFMIQLNSSINATVITCFSKELRKFTKKFLCSLINGE